jgi:hypothetical protein
MNVIGDAAGSAAAMIFVIALWLAGSAAYFAPTITAVVRKSRDLGVVAVINMFLGWTLVGWVVALAFAMRDNPTRNQQPWPQPYPYGQPPQQYGWPAQPPMWPHPTTPPPYDYPTNPGTEQTFPYVAPDDQLSERRRRHTF